MKRALALLLPFCMAFCLVACNIKLPDTTEPESSSLQQSETDPVTQGDTTPVESTAGVETTAPQQIEKPTEQTAPGGETEPSTEPGTEQTQPTEPANPDKPVENPGATHKHSYSGKVTTKAGCSATGVKTFTCSCGASYTEKIPATGHSWSGWKTTKEPTTTAEGTSKRECSACKLTESKPIPKLPADSGNENLVTKAQLQTIEREFLNLVNQERERVGVTPLSMDSYLDSCAQIRSVECQESFSHTRPNGQSFSSVVDISQYPYSIVGENLCMTSHIGSGYYYESDKWVGSDEQLYQAAAQIFKCFKDSPGHYANMINEDYRHCGIGVTYIPHDQVSVPIFYIAHIFGVK